MKEQGRTYEKNDKKQSKKMMKTKVVKLFYPVISGVTWRSYHLSKGVLWAKYFLRWKVNRAWTGILQGRSTPEFVGGILGIPSMFLYTHNMQLWAPEATYERKKDFKTHVFTPTFFRGIFFLIPGGGPGTPQFFFILLVLQLPQPLAKH